MYRHLPVIPVRGSGRSSQESKVTSTPRTGSPVVSVSPSISSIGNEEVPMEVESDAGTNVTSTGAGTSSNDSVISQAGRRKVVHVKEIKFEGYWAPLQPRNKDGLYYKIMKQPGDVESIAVDLMETYRDDRKTAVVSLIQLFVNLCGYKKLAVGRIYNFAEPNPQEFVQKMKSELMETDLKKTGKFLFIKCSHFESKVDHVLSNFINALIAAGFQSEVLFDGIFMEHVLEFINSMSFSTLRCIRIPGVVLVLKLLTALVNLYAKYFTNNSDKSSNSEENTGDNKKFAVESFIDFLYLVYDKNVLIPDKKCYTIKVKCAQEMLHWIKTFPGIFIFKRKCLGRLMKLVLDQNEIVRRSALDTCEALLTCDEIKNEMEQRTELCLKILSTRVVDVSFNIAIKAITIFTKVLDRYPEYITQEYKQCIIYRMFEKNVATARASGKFLAAYLRHQNADPRQLLLHLVKIAFIKKEFAERLPYFLESCIDFTPELKDWNLVTALLSDKLPLVSRERMLRIFHETVRFSLTGKFSIMRQKPDRDVALKSEDRVEIVNVVIPKFENIISQFQTDKTCMKLVTEILIFVKYDEEDPEIVQNHYPAIFGLLRDLFNVSNDKGLLEDIAEIFSCFSENRYYLANVLVDSIKHKYVDTLKEDLKQLSPNHDRNLLMRLRETSMKLSILFVKFDLTADLQWEDIFQVWDKNTLKALKYLVSCCKWYLVWSLRKFIKASMGGENGAQGNHSLYNNCKDFIYGCLELLPHVKESESILVFEELCDLYTNFEIELRRKRQYSIFFIKVDHTKHQEALMNFGISSVFENTKLHLDDRQKLLCKLVDVIYLEVVPVEHFAKILRHYCTHYTDFAPIMDNIITRLSSSTPALPLLLIHTLTQMYREILSEQKIANMLSEKWKQLKMLAKKFSSLKEIKSPNVALKMVNMSICFSFRKKENSQFLYLARYFAKLLDESGKSDAYNLFMEMVPEQDKKDDIILIFAASLK